MMRSTLAMTAALWRTECPTLGHSIQLEGLHQKCEAIREIRARLPHRDSFLNNEEVSFLMSAMSTLVTVEVRGILTIKELILC